MCEITDIEELRAIYSNNLTHAMAYGESKIYGQIEPDMGYHHMAFCNEQGVVVGIIPWKKLNRLMGEVHIHVMPQFWGKGFSYQIAKMMNDWFKTNTNFIKLLTWTSASHNTIHKFVTNIGFKKIGEVPESCLYNSEVCDTILYYIDLYNNNLGD